MLVVILYASMGIRLYGFLLFEAPTPILKSLFYFFSILVIITALANITALGLCYKYYGKGIPEIYEKRATMSSLKTPNTPLSALARQTPTASLSAVTSLA